MENLTVSYKSFLKQQGVSPVTVKNYLSDLSHFTNWYEFYLYAQGVKELNESVFFEHLTKQTINSYREFLLVNQTTVATTNRRLSSLRKIGNFGLYLGCLTENPGVNVENLESERQLSAENILQKFEKFLGREGVSDSTKKNYLSDVRQFLAWLEATA